MNPTYPISQGRTDRNDLVLMHRNLENILIEGRIPEGVQPQPLVLKLIQEFLAKKKFKIGNYITSKQIEKK